MAHDASVRTAAIRTVYVRGLGLVHLIAFVSLWWQLDALMGSDGIYPAAATLDAARSQLGPQAWFQLPTLAWFSASDLTLHAMCAGGVACACLLLGGMWFEGPLLAVLAVLYLSLTVLGLDFYMFQWDSLLIEASVVALLVARWWPSAQEEPPRWAWWMQRWLVFRLLFFGGLVKWTSGDPTWAAFTALDVHFFTQPLPNPLSRFAHHLPSWLHALGVAFTLAVELVLPWAMVAGRTGRLAVFAGATALMGMLALTGNYGFFQVLTVVLCLSLLDDDHLAKMFDPGRIAQSVPRSPSRWAPRWGLALAGVLLVLSALQMPGYRALPGWAQQVVRVTAPFRLVNRYGLFAVMTTERPEIIFEGSDDGQSWRELSLRYKPGPVDRIPPQVAPYMPRVDWQMWFAALGRCDGNPWVIRLMQRILEGSDAIEPLFVSGTFGEVPPRRVRAVLYRYTFSAPGSPHVWDRKRLGLYCPALGD